MPPTALTVILFQNSEKGPEYLKNYLGAMREWNKTGLDETQFILVSQKPVAAEAFAECARQPFPVDIVHGRHEVVGGYPIWDVMETLRRVWSLVRGRYVTVNHTEFLWCPSRLPHSIAWLKREKPYLALGNLRRPGAEADIPHWKFPTCTKEVSDQLSHVLQKGHWGEAAHLVDQLPNLRWMYWSPEQKPGLVPWVEDIFYADREWLEAWDFAGHGGELPFQDVYDLVGLAVQIMRNHGTLPQVHRMPLETNKVIHIWHPKGWKSWTPDIRDWFLAQPERWRKTSLLDAGLWQRLIECRGENMPRNEQPVITVRRGPGGTVTRYGKALDDWLGNGGKARMNEFYHRHGQGRRAS